MDMDTDDDVSMNPNIPRLQGLEELSFHYVLYEENDEGDGHVHMHEDDSTGDCYTSNNSGSGNEASTDDVHYDSDGNFSQGDRHDMGDGLGVLFNEDAVLIDFVQQIRELDLRILCPVNATNFLFASLSVAWFVYKMYGRSNGFAIRNSSKLRNNTGEVTQQTFLCNRQGFREDRGLTEEQRKQEQKAHTRCECRALFRVSH
ncbi:FAR1 DNA-binding domain [Sesbania bispinosa]|nr:FAR1 DNA-binding domain [Sesbania bispinosa]